LSGKYALPFYGDFPGMSDVERRSTWNLMLGEESTTKIIIDSYNKAGYDESRDLLPSYKYMEGASLAQWREGGYGGGILVDWNLKTSRMGYIPPGHKCLLQRTVCAAAGRYAGRKAAAIALVGESISGTD
jgi:hypothetical protein